MLQNRPLSPNESEPAGSSRAIAITSIQAPTKCVQEILSKYSDTYTIYVVGDRKSPSAYSDRVRFLTLEDQCRLEFRLPKLLPENHYSRKNVAYLLALKDGVQTLIDADDDNAPLSNVEFELSAQVAARSVLGEGMNGWVNVYRYFTNVHIWPRGFPLDLVRADSPPLAENATSIFAPVQQYLVQRMPDVDAIWRLVTQNQFVDFQDNLVVNLPPGMFCPFNSQCTLWHRYAFPYLYLPSTCSMRMTDIWRSLIAQRCLHEEGIGMVFRSPVFYQDRNTHNNMKDFADELSGYLHNKNIVSILNELVLVKGKPLENLRSCYQCLVENCLLQVEELQFLQAWIDDFQSSSKFD